MQPLMFVPTACAGRSTGNEARGPRNQQGFTKGDLPPFPPMTFAGPTFQVHPVHISPAKLPRQCHIHHEGQKALKWPRTPVQTKAMGKDMFFLSFSVKEWSKPIRSHWEVTRFLDHLRSRPHLWPQPSGSKVGTLVKKIASAAILFLPIKMQSVQVQKSFEIQTPLFSTNQILFFWMQIQFSIGRQKSSVLWGIRTDRKPKPTTSV